MQMMNILNELRVYIDDKNYNTDTADLLVKGLANTTRLNVTIYILSGENGRAETHRPPDGNTDHCVETALLLAFTAIVSSRWASKRKPGYRLGFRVTIRNPTTS